MKFLRITRINLYSFLTAKNLILLIAIFFTHYLFSINLYGFHGINNSLILFYYGPFHVNVDFLKWLLHQVPIIVLAGYFINKEFKEKTIYILPRVGSVSLWLDGIIFSCFVLVFLYYVIGMIVTVLLLYLNNGSVFNEHILKEVHLLSEYTPLYLGMHQFFLLLLSTVVIILINTLMTIIIKHAIAAYGISILMIFLSVGLGYDFPELNKWFPPTQGMLVKHEVSHFSFLWSYSYILVVGITSIFILHIFIKNHIEKILSEENI